MNEQEREPEPDPEFEFRPRQVIPGEEFEPFDITEVPLESRLGPDNSPFLIECSVHGLVALSMVEGSYQLGLDDCYVCPHCEIAGQESVVMLNLRRLNTWVSTTSEGAAFAEAHKLNAEYFEGLEAE